MEQPGFLVCSRVNTPKSCQINQISFLFCFSPPGIWEGREAMRSFRRNTVCEYSSRKADDLQSLREQMAVSGNDVSIIKLGPI